MFINLKLKAYKWYINHFKLGSITLACLFIVLLTFPAFAQLLPIRPKIGLALSGGGAKGFAHIGVLKVLSQSGISFDYIAGTSMGALVGGLTAAGYTPIQLDSIVSEQDWDFLLSDDPKRKDLPIIEKFDANKAFAELPFKRGKISLPSGLINGQHINLLLSRLLFNYHGTVNFEKLKIPFFCVSANIETGQYVIHNRGNLPLALRASMGIPTIFKPVTINNQVLVDGGLVNNFPVKELKAAGMDLVIGVDVQNKPKKRKDFNSVIDVLNQTTGIVRLNNNQEQQNECSFIIEPDITGYKVGDFNNADSLIARGEMAAKKTLPELLKYLESVGITPNKIVEKKIEEPDSLLIENFIVNGIEKLSPNFVFRIIDRILPCKMTLDEIDKLIGHIYATRYFDEVNYQLIKIADVPSYELNINCTERTDNIFRVGVHYDTDFKASIFLGATWRNKFVDGSKITAEMRLGENPRALAYLYIDGRKLPGLLVESEGQLFDVPIYEKNNRISLLRFLNLRASAASNLQLSNYGMLGMGLMAEQIYAEPKIAPAGFGTINQRLVSAFGAMRFDTYNRLYYPRNGFQLNAQVRFVRNLEAEFKNILRTPVFLLANYSPATPINKRITLLSQLTFGSYSIKPSDTATPSYNFYLGGLGNLFTNGLLPFVGVRFMQLTGTHTAIARFDLQTEVYRNHFIIPRFNVARITNSLEGLFDLSDLVWGYGLSYGYSTILGPIEFTAMHSTEGDVLGYLTVGFFF